MKSMFLFGMFALLISVAEAQAAPVFVLVHGANFTSRSWKWVQDDLTHAGFQSLAPQLYQPSENVDLSTVSSRLCGVLSSLNSPVILVAHSQGGAIATQAAAECSARIQGIIYVAAVVPPSGTGVFDQLSDTDNAYYGQCGVLDQQSNTYVLKSLDACRPVFFADVPESSAQQYFDTMESEPAAIGNSKASYSAAQLSSIPRFYIETLQDLIVGYASQKIIVTQETLRAVLQINSSHAPFFAEHEQLSSLLESIEAQISGR
jgi:pimeloyl-ACP methyl ester carboxylesterase